MDLRFRHTLREGDVEGIVQRHRVLYATESGFDATFATYVEEALRGVVARRNPRDRVWVAESSGRFAGCVALVERSAIEAQLRWFLVEPWARRRGIGRGLIEMAIAFARAQKYARILLWTVASLAAAGRLYAQLGFVRTETLPGRRWGVEVVEECYVKELGSGREAEADVTSP